MILYLDSSAAAKLLVDEAESAALIAFLDASTEDVVVSSTLLMTELRRLASRMELAQTDVSDLLARVDLIDPERALCHEAGVLPGAHLRSLDALHLATALRADAEIVVTYDTRLMRAARSLGLGVNSPT